MQSQSQIRRKLQRITYFYLKKRYERGLSRRPWNCRFNHLYRSEGNHLVHPVAPIRRLVPYPEATLGDAIHPSVSVGDGGGQVRLCLYGSESAENWSGLICEDINTAKKCPMFDLIKDQNQLAEDLACDLRDPEIVSRDFKDIAALQWVLDEKTLNIKMSWWQRLKIRLSLLNKPGRMESPDTEGDQLLLDQLFSLKGDD